jgi:hypothetical protein
MSVIASNVFIVNSVCVAVSLTRKSCLPGVISVWF